MTVDEFQESFFNQIARIGDKPLQIRNSKGVLQKVTRFELKENVIWDEVINYEEYHQQIDYVELVLKYGI